METFSSKLMVRKHFMLRNTMVGMVTLLHKIHPPSTCTSLLVSWCRLRIIMVPECMAQTTEVSSAPGSLASCLVPPNVKYHTKAQLIIRTEMLNEHSKFEKDEKENEKEKESMLLNFVISNLCCFQSSE